MIQRGNRSKVMAWVGSDILPHEPSVRAWLRRSTSAEDVDDIVQEAYCRISSLADVAHIRSGRAYLFTTARMLLLERIRRARVVSIEAVAEIDALDAEYDAPSPERIVSGRRELARVRALLDLLPERCRRIVELRKMQGLSQREVATLLDIPEHTVENDVAKGIKVILDAIARSEILAEEALFNVRRDEPARNRNSD